MVVMARKVLEKSLAGVNQSIKRSTPDPLLGVLEENTLSLYQEGYLSVWDNIKIPNDLALEKTVFAVDGDALHAVIAAMATDEVDVTVNEKFLGVKSGKSSVKIPYQATFTTAEIEQPQFETVIELPSAFITALVKALRFVAKTEDKPSLSCIYVRIHEGKVYLFATDAFRMYATQFADVSLDASLSLDILIPERCAASMIKIFTGSDVRLGVTERKHIVMSSDDSTTFMLTPGFNEQYPATVFNILEDKGQPCFIANRDQFIKTIRLGNSFSAGDKLTIHNVDGDIRLTFNQSRMDSDLHLEGLENIESFTEATFNPRFLLDCLQSLDKRIYISQQRDGQGPLRMSSDDNTVTLVHKISI